MSRRTAVISGIGVIAPNGLGRAAYWEALGGGVSGIRMISLIDVSAYPCRVGGEVAGFTPADYLEKKDARRLPRATCLAVAAARMALADAGLAGISGRETAVALGTTTSDTSVIETASRAVLKRGVSGVSPFFVATSSPNCPVSEICRNLRLAGLQRTFANDCTAGLDAIAEVARLVVAGQFEIGLAGGVDSPFTSTSWGGLCRSGLMPRREDRPEGASRPFDRDREGGVAAEGAAVFVIEEKRAARLRGAPLYCELAGCGTSGNGEFRKGMARAMTAALAAAAVSPSEIDYISAHGSGDPFLDREETAVIRAVFGARADRLPVSSIKSMTGNPLAAAGPLQVAGMALSLVEGLVPPTINLENPDPECDLDFVPGRARRNEVNAGLVNSHGLGGANTCLVMKRCRPAGTAPEDSTALRAGSGLKGVS